MLINCVIGPLSESMKETKQEVASEKKHAASTAEEERSL